MHVPSNGGLRLYGPHAPAVLGPDGITCRSGGETVSPVAWVGWAGGQAAVRVTGQPPAALVDRPVMGPAQQGQVLEVGGAAMEPMSEMVGFAPGQGPVAAGEHTAAVAHGQGGALGGGHDPAGPADLQRLGWRPATQARMAAWGPGSRRR